MIKSQASFLQLHKNAHAVVDLTAAQHLTRISHPWLVGSCRWSDMLTRRAIVWLCQQTGKPILKLTNKDYNQYGGLNELLALYGSAYNVNIKIFNDLQRTITGWPGRKPNADDSNRAETCQPLSQTGDHFQSASRGRCDFPWEALSSVWLSRITTYT